MSTSEKENTVPDEWCVVFVVGFYFDSENSMMSMHFLEK